MGRGIADLEKPRLCISCWVCSNTSASARSRQHASTWDLKQFIHFIENETLNGQALQAKDTHSVFLKEQLQSRLFHPALPNPQQQIKIGWPSEQLQVRTKKYLHAPVYTFEELVRLNPDLTSILRCPGMYSVWLKCIIELPQHVASAIVIACCFVLRHALSGPNALRDEIVLSGQSDKIHKLARQHNYVAQHEGFQNIRYAPRYVFTHFEARDSPTYFRLAIF